MAAQRTYLAIDLKSFYASVECVDRHLDPLTTNLVVGLGEEDFASLSPELTQKYEELFHQPETFMRLGRQMLVLPVPDENVRTETAKAKPPAAHER